LVSGDNGVVLSTADGGTIWLPVNVRTNPKLSGLYFADETLGWAAGDDGLVLRTDDSGFSWRRLTEGGRDDLSQLFFLDNSHGWAVGARGKILFTGSAERTGQFALQAPRTV